MATASNRATIRSYQDLNAWQLAMRLAGRVYRATKLFPKEELFGMVQQTRRAAVSVPSNIAEGYGRGSRRDYVSFLRIARGSLYEVETNIILAEQLEYLNGKQAKSLLDDLRECSRTLQGLIKSLSKKE